MDKYAWMRVGCMTIFTIIMDYIGYGIFTWQFWVVYLLAWVMGLIQFIEDNCN